MISATNAAALDAMLASPCRRHGKRAPGTPDAERLTSYRVLETASKSTTKAQQGLYEYDAVSRLRDASSATRA
jgi:hypothetical protein